MVGGEKRWILFVMIVKNPHIIFKYLVPRVLIDATEFRE